MVKSECALDLSSLQFLLPGCIFLNLDIVFGSC